jgi:hypothetical protein
LKSSVASDAAAFIGQLSSTIVHVDIRQKIREVEHRRRAANCHRAVRIEAEEKHSGNAVAYDVGPDVDFVERRDPGQSGDTSRAQVAETERRDANPRLVVKCVELEKSGHHLAQPIAGDRPVREHEIVPRLLQDPGVAGQRPGPVADVFEELTGV